MVGSCIYQGNMNIPNIPTVAVDIACILAYRIGMYMVLRALCECIVYAYANGLGIVKFQKL